MDHTFRGRRRNLKETRERFVEAFVNSLIKQKRGQTTLNAKATAVLNEQHVQKKYMSITCTNTQFAPDRRSLRGRRSYPNKDQPFGRQPYAQLEPDTIWAVASGRGENEHRGCDEPGDVKASNAFHMRPREPWRVARMASFKSESITYCNVIRANDAAQRRLSISHWAWRGETPNEPRLNMRRQKS
jgi:hypothetical protein